MRTKDLELILLGLTLATPISVMVKAEVYYSEAEAVKAIFPREKFEATWTTLTEEQATTVEKKSSEKVHENKIRIWKSKLGSMVFIDKVVGKHDFITYAVGITSKGKVKGVEIMEYRESYGSEVREAPWRGQFVDKDSSDPLKVNVDIKNISGATLSSVHVTGGVRRILQIYEAIKNS